MASQRGKYWRALVFLVVLIGGLWGLIAGLGYEPRLGLDLQGGISVIMEPAPGQATDAAALEKAVDIIQQRVDGLGVAEPDIALQGSNISVQLPGVKRATEALAIIGRTAKLTFRPVIADLGPGDTATAPKGLTLPDCADPTTFADDVADAEVVYCLRGRDDEGDLPNEEWTLLHLGPVALEGSDVATATVELPGAQSGSAGYSVSLNLTSAGTRKFGDVTTELATTKQQLAIVLDKVVESAPTVQEPITGGTASITGSFSESEARELALILRYGALPIELRASATQTISPTLGRESLEDGLLAGVIGLGVVFLYVLLFYRALGLLIWVGIAIHAALTVAVIIVLGQLAGFALSLAGIAGLIVSLGIASDSFIVYFERIKDEVHSGRSLRGAVDRAWPSAWRTILAADLVTALAAIVLYFLAVGSVRGFALTLGLSTALDLFVSRLFMHPAVWLMSQTKMLSGSKTLGFGGVAGIRRPAVGSEA